MAAEGIASAASSHLKRVDLVRHGRQLFPTTAHTTSVTWKLAGHVFE
jgi:hypothetical protein